MKYVIVGGNPLKVYTGTTTFTALRCLGVTDDADEARKILKDNYETSGGLLTAFDTETGKELDE